MDNNEDAAFEEARRRSLLENYKVEGEPSRAADVAATTTKPTTTKVVEEEVEEEMVDYEPSPEIFEVPCDPLVNVVREYEIDEALRRVVHEDIMIVLTQFLPSSAPEQREVPVREEVQKQEVMVEDVARENQPREVKVQREVLPIEVPQFQVDDAREVLPREVETLQEDDHEDASQSEVPQEVVLREKKGQTSTARRLVRRDVEREELHADELKDEMTLPYMLRPSPAHQGKTTQTIYSDDLVEDGGDMIIQEVGQSIPVSSHQSVETSGKRKREEDDVDSERTLSLEPEDLEDPDEEVGHFELKTKEAWLKARMKKMEQDEEMVMETLK